MQAPNGVLSGRIEKNNPNSGRRYRSCSNQACRSFNGFVDDRGLNSWNPMCRCQIRSRLVARNMRNRSTGLWEAFYSCQNKGCKFWQAYEDDNGYAQGFSDAQLNTMISRKEILGYSPSWCILARRRHSLASEISWLPVCTAGSFIIPSKVGSKSIGC